MTSVRLRTNYQRPRAAFFRPKGFPLGILRHAPRLATVSGCEAHVGRGTTLEY